VNWHLKKDDAVYGPVDLATLQHWAADGRIAPDDVLSTDLAAWIRARDMADLKMDWVADLGQGAEMGPLHLLALLDYLRDGTVRPETAIRHKRTGEQKQAGAAVLEAMAEQNQQLLAEIATLTTRVKDLENELGRLSAASPPPITTGSGSKEQWSELKRVIAERDHFEREAGKWKKMFEDELKNSLRKEQSFNERAEAFRQGEITARDQISRLERTIAQLEKKNQMLQDMTENRAGADSLPAHLSVLMNNYDVLLQNYDRLLTQLAGKSAEVEAARVAGATAEKTADERVRQMEERLQLERQSADQIRRRMAEMEESHQHLLKSYRELNDRFIRLHQGKKIGGSQ